ncbi:hypothetical protein H5410_055387 [Solanum commersonii]|uniref:Uncharacterized protein n=1 Tax=Solanum commersonii TaxID=4109 RepID=A0A9J5WIJ4_SOLCO|nr:hypothetical protein H5410_055387 [Solanum commersonii]
MQKRCDAFIPMHLFLLNESPLLSTCLRRAFLRTTMEVVDTNLFHKEEQITSKSEICIAYMMASLPMVFLIKNNHERCSREA